MIMSKLENILKQLPEPYASQAIANTNDEVLKYANHFETPEKAIAGSFTWDHSPEGHKYWQDLHAKLLDNKI